MLQRLGISSHSAECVYKQLNTHPICSRSQYKHVQYRCQCISLITLHYKHVSLQQGESNIDKHINALCACACKGTQAWSNLMELDLNTHWIVVWPSTMATPWQKQKRTGCRGFHRCWSVKTSQKYAKTPIITHDCLHGSPACIAMTTSRWCWLAPWSPVYRWCWTVAESDPLSCWWHSMSQWIAQGIHNELHCCLLFRPKFCHFCFASYFHTLPGQPPETLTTENGCFQWSVVASGPPIPLCW